MAYPPRLRSEKILHMQNFASQEELKKKEKSFCDDVAIYTSLVTDTKHTGAIFSSDPFHEILLESL